MTASEEGFKRRFQLSRMREGQSPEGTWRYLVWVRPRISPAGMGGGSYIKTQSSPPRLHDRLSDTIPLMRARVKLVGAAGFKFSAYPGLMQELRDSDQHGWIAWNILPDLRTVLDFATKKQNELAEPIAQVVKRAETQASEFIADRLRTACLDLEASEIVDPLIVHALTGHGAVEPDNPCQSPGSIEREKVNEWLQIDCPWVNPPRSPTPGEQIVTQMRGDGYSADDIERELEASPFGDNESKKMLAEIRQAEPGTGSRQLHVPASPASTASEAAAAGAQNREPPIPPEEVKGQVMSIGATGADPVLLAALDSAAKVAAFPMDKWNAMQGARPGADHQRWHTGETVTADELASLESVANLLRLSGHTASEMAETEQKPQPPVPIVVDVAQVKASVGVVVSKLTNRRQAEMLSAVVKGNGDWVPKASFAESHERPDRVFDRLPAHIRKRIEGKRGSGYRVVE